MDAGSLRGLMVVVATLGAQQTREAGDSVLERQLRGRVVDGRDGAALPRARVVVSAGGRHALPVFTDDRGRFVVAVAPADGYLVRVSKAMYAAEVVTSTTGAPVVSSTRPSTAAMMYEPAGRRARHEALIQPPQLECADPSRASGR